MTVKSKNAYIFYVLIMFLTGCNGNSNDPIYKFAASVDKKVCKKFSNMKLTGIGGSETSDRKIKSIDFNYHDVKRISLSESREKTWVQISKAPHFKMR